MDDREIKMLAAKIIEADPKALGAAIEEVIRERKKTAEIEGAMYYTPDSICGAGGYLEKIGVKQGLAKFLKMSDDLELHRYRGADFVKLIGCRPAKSGCKPKCYEIIVQKDKIQNNAVCYIDDEITFEIVNHGMSSSDVEAMAVSALHRLVKRRKQANERRHRSRKRKQIEKLALNGVSE